MVNQVHDFNPVIHNQQMKSSLVFQNRWESGLCDCCSDIRSCCIAWWCWPCFLCCLDSNARECACTTCGLHIIGGYCTGIGILRAKIRGTYRIDGSVIEDFCCSLFCPFCTVLQIYREMKYRGDSEDD